MPPPHGAAASRDALADSPVASARVAEDKLRAIARAAAMIEGRAPAREAAPWQ
jgi:hypothetical protein